MRQFITLDSVDDAPLLADVVGTWNGFAVPALTADALADYYRLIGATDVRIAEDGDIMTLSYTDDDAEPTKWQAVTTDDRGRNVYHVDGLVWTTLDDDEILEAVAGHLDSVNEWRAPDYRKGRRHSDGGYAFWQTDLYIPSGSVR